MAQISDREKGLISAYLDGQVSARERAAVERLLQSSPQARQELADLRQLRTTLQSLPVRKAPHNFTLTRAMAQEQRMPRSIPLLRLSSVLSAVLMAFLFIFQLGPRVVPTAMAPAADSAVLESYQAPAAEEAYNAAPIIVWNQGGMGGGGGGDGSNVVGMGGAGGSGLPGAPEALPIPPELATEPLAPDQTAKDGPGPTPTPIDTARELQPTPEPTPEPEVQALAAEPAATSGEDTILGVNGTEAGQWLYTEGAASNAVPETSNPLTGFIWTQVALGAAAFGTGLAAILLTRKFRRG